MKVLISVLFTILCSNLSQAAICETLFEHKNTRLSPTDRVQRFEDFKSIQEKVEELSLKNYSVKEVVRMSFPELKTDIINQILMLERAISLAKDRSSFIRSLATFHVNTLYQSSIKKLTLENHYFISLRTLILLDYLLKEREYFEAKFTGLKKSRLENFIKGKKYNEIEFGRTFPKMKKFFMEWSFAIHDKTFSKARIPIFSTLEPNLTEFNPLLSMSYSFIGLIDHTANPDNIGTMTPVSYALHDITHISLSRGHEPDWEGVLKPKQQKALMLEIRKNYLRTRESLDPKARLSLDILYFDFHHEDTNILPKFIKEVKRQGGKFTQHYDLNYQNVLNYAEVNGLIVSAKYAYKSEIPHSNLDTSSLEALAQSLKPYWYLLTDIWLKAYNSLEGVDSERL